jgi:hypothetical protein
MAVLPDLDAMALCTTVMFEKANPISASTAPHARGLRHASAGPAERFESRGPRRAGDALRAVEWSEITARLNAARDLRLLLRNESQAPIEMVAASFGDAAASYFALLDDSEPRVNPDALGQSKALGAKTEDHNANRPGRASVESTDAAQGDAREMQ